MPSTLSVMSTTPPAIRSTLSEWMPSSPAAIVRSPLSTVTWRAASIASEPAVRSSVPPSIQMTPTAASGSSATDSLSERRASPWTFEVRVPPVTTRWSFPRRPSSAASSVTSPPAITRESLEVIASAAWAVTESAPSPAIHRSALENSVALGASSTVSSTADPATSASRLSLPSASHTTTWSASTTLIAATSTAVMSTPSSTRLTTPSGASTTSEPEVSVPLTR